MVLKKSLQVEKGIFLGDLWNEIDRNDIWLGIYSFPILFD